MSRAAPLLDNLRLAIEQFLASACLSDCDGCRSVRQVQTGYSSLLDESCREVVAQIAQQLSVADPGVGDHELELVLANQQISLLEGEALQTNQAQRHI